ncbi:cellulose biosynthesis protein BcsE [Edwardsiella hoshinae]|uniref:Cellulose biosynthesis protein BcsE n=1 Tax=Edwardsiella hoshinae TaxID=93378 RepID=A0A376D633_9GAMM|nr:cellulose biosynthesis protein BcsE [Edwardsiella hoshinae]AOV95571.1 cellulose biosynthesis protein BcsE [Edwardsiella hoshinae]QPR28586.1 cellulose biosynthesis protein BcsE [Edwardsiella hoshinae]STC82727.1 cellulose biosynthesis protein BcsE [Edwardsiella hoshinae]
MAQSFTLGISQLWDELQTAQIHGLYWLGCDRAQDALSLCGQTIQAQHATTRVTLIDVGSDTPSILAEGYQSGPESLAIYRLIPTPAALMALPDELHRLLSPRPHLLIILLPVAALLHQPMDWITNWLHHLSNVLQRHNATLLIFNHGAGNDVLRNQLIPLNRLLYGLVSLRWQLDCWRYDLAFWSNALGVSAQQNIELITTPQGWQVTSDASITLQSHQDEHEYLAHVAALEGAPPLSEHWHLFASNQELFTAALTAQAATLLFSLSQNDQVDDLARQIHTLRRQRGNALKIVVRELMTMQRSSDERLLLACGANSIIPLSATLSNTLVIIEGLQGHIFPHHVPANITTLLNSLRPLKLRGYQPYSRFCALLLDLLDNPLLPRNGRGTLVSLQPIAGMEAEQLLALCRLRRDGDLITLDQQRLVLFLAYCRPHELKTALRSVFPLSIAELFSSYRVWHQDSELLLELTRMRDQAPAPQQTLDAPPPSSSDRPAPREVPAPRRLPTPIVLGQIPQEPTQ